ARPAAAMGDIEPAVRLDTGARAAGDEEGVGRFDYMASRIVEGGQRLRRLRRSRLGRRHPRLNVLRAIAEALRDRDGDAIVGRGDTAVGAIASPRGEVEAEQADRLAGREAAGCRIA